MTARHEAAGHGRHGDLSMPLRAHGQADHARARKSVVKRWFAMLPALNVSEPSSLRRSDVVRVISLYSTTSYDLLRRQTTPTFSDALDLGTTLTPTGTPMVAQ